MNKYIFLILFFPISLIAQNKLSFEIGSNFITSSNELLPHYTYSNKWGIINPFQKNQGLLLMSGKYNLIDKQKININIGVSGLFFSYDNHAYLQEAFASGSLFKIIDFSLGKQMYSPIATYEELTVGAFLGNSNAKPIPRATFGFFDYVPLRFLKNYLEIKGGISQGILDDDRYVTDINNCANDVLLHEKWVYVRYGRGKIKPYAGIYHSALFGGKKPDGTNIPIDLKATFLSQSSDKIGGGDSVYIAGAHEGLWDFGVDYKTNDYNLKLYLQKPFTDGSGLELFSFKNLDYKIGLIADIKNNKFLKTFAVEYFYTADQSGEGLADILHPITGNQLFLGQIDDFDKAMYDIFGKKTKGYDRDKFLQYFIDNYNNGYKYGGRDNYDNNDYYYKGWTYNDLMTGFPMFHTADIAKRYAPEWNFNNFGYIVNNRVLGFNIAAKGNILDNLEYRIKITPTVNKGAYDQKYIHRYIWREKKNYLFKSDKYETYSSLLLNYKFKKYKKISVFSEFNYDFGDLYHSFSLNTGFKFNF